MQEQQMKNGLDGKPDADSEQPTCLFKLAFALAWLAVVETCAELRDRVVASL